MILRDIDIEFKKLSGTSSDKQLFKAQSCCVTELFVDLVRKCKLQTVEISKIFICLTEDLDPLTDIIMDQVMLGVQFVRIGFDLEEFKSCDMLRKKKIIADVYIAVLKFLSKIYGWDEKLADKIGKKADALDYEFSGDLKKWHSPDRLKFAIVSFRYSHEAFTLSVKIFKRNGELILDKEIYRATPFIDQLSAAVGKCVWQSNSLFVVRPKLSTLYKVVKVSI